MISRKSNIFITSNHYISRIGITYGVASTDILKNFRDCYDAGCEYGQDWPFDEGANDEFDQDRDECKDKGDQYSR
jgi:hypothetical protein